MISAIRSDGTTACMTIDAPTDSEIFRVFAEQILVPFLRPGDVVIMDNLRAHKQESIPPLVTAAGASLLYLPPYSPDLNPIEKMWSKIKEFLRATKARTSESLDEAITKAFLVLTPKDALSWSASCGYTIS